jgi:hypothetical protein
MKLKGMCGAHWNPFQFSNSVPRGRRMMVFVLNPFKPDTLFSIAKNRLSRKIPPQIQIRCG